ncbi:MAG: hypothetical protein PW788_03760 [Micavibrio sp.]|nr:hypothetical protein [Micavibrio sp.]
MKALPQHKIHRIVICTAAKCRPLRRFKPLFKRDLAKVFRNF